MDGVRVARAPDSGDNGIDARGRAKDVTEAVRHGKHIPDVLARRLDDLRYQRNKWLHDGLEPDEGSALEAVKTSVEMLKSYVPDLQVGTRRDLLIL